MTDCLSSNATIEERRAYFRQKTKEWRLRHPENVNKPVLCACGETYARNAVTQHRRTKLHQKSMILVERINQLEQQLRDLISP
jgi:hypothetical protein